MEDRKLKGLQKENESLKNQLAENDSWSQAYKCNMCGNNVNYIFIMPFMKAKGICPSCYWEDENA